MKNKERSVIFCQSLRDFPCPVVLGKNMPTFGLHRFKNGLKFFPTDDEGFTLRGDKRRLLYKGRKKSHRFTILGDTAFEYDCILKSEPESNVISLRMEGAEKFDFFRQPDFVKQPFLKGSYAVYKKDTWVGEGTGKLCHIHRPEIIDARGRRCWGELAVVGDMLHITIPENWLADAKYPIVVDPLIGTTVVGSQYLYLYNWEDVEEYGEEEEWYEYFIECAIGVNRFLVSDLLNGNATAYVYVYNDDYYGVCKPVLYSDNGNTPLSRRSANEGNFDIVVKNGKPQGWRSISFQTNTSIASGTYLWFGLFCEWFAPRFDYGAKYYEHGYNFLVSNNIPNTYPLLNANVYFDYKLSMYFTYGPAQNYVRTVTQGVRLTDTKRLTGNYKRNLTQTAGVSTLIKRIGNFYRNFLMTAYNSMTINRYPVFYRKVIENINVVFDLSQLRLLIRNCTENIYVNSQASRMLNIRRKIQDIFNTTDNQYYPVLFIRSVNDNVQITDIFSHWGAFIRGLRVNAGSAAEIERKANYYRSNRDTVQTIGVGLRSLFVFVRVVSRIIFRDYILRRFLRAKEDFILKSPICRELKLDSKID
jgi:hypothetical protein